MKTFACSLIAVSALFATVAEAKEPRGIRAMRTQLARQAAEGKGKRAIAPQCANFTGKWEGTCTYDGSDPEPATTTIEQEGCTYLDLDGVSIEINGTLTLASAANPMSGDGAAFSATLGLAWNDSQTRLNMLASVNFLTGTYAGAMRSSMWLSGEQLRVKDEQATEILNIGGDQPFRFAATDCTYDRVDEGR